MQDMEDRPKKERKPGSGGKREGAGRKTERPTVSVSLTLFVDQVQYVDDIAGESNRSNVARLLIDLAIAAEKEGQKKGKKAA